MAGGEDRLVVFVHGWGVTNTSSYGQLPARLQSEARNDAGLSLDIRHVWLSQYVTFRDTVQLPDVSRAFDAAIRREIGRELSAGRRFICIAHSTGGPAVRDWLDRYYVQKQETDSCPMSHLIMLAPPNFGSALAQLGKSRLGRIKAWFEGVEPGEGLLQWLELGSPESWELNRRWFDYPDAASGRFPVFLFVLTGQRIDRALYDHVNSYTGEPGSDGVVRAASANLNARFVELVQELPRSLKRLSGARREAPRLEVGANRPSPRTAFAILEGCSHCGAKMGILRSVRDDSAPHPTVAAALQCIGVRNKEDYQKLCDAFDRQTEETQERERVEKAERLLLPDSRFIHDPHSMVIFRLQDDQGRPVEEFDLKLTAGPKSSPDHLPTGFFRDRQRNSRHWGTLTYFLNWALMQGCPAVKDEGGKVIRSERGGAESLGFLIQPHVTRGPVHYLKAGLIATAEQLGDFVKPNQTTLVNVALRRVVREGLLRLTTDQAPRSFKNDPPGEIIP